MHYRIYVAIFLILTLLMPNRAFTRTILITAATSGLGESICEMLAKVGNHLILAGRNPDKLRILKEKLQGKYKGKYTTLDFDYGNLASIQQLSTQVTP